MGPMVCELDGPGPTLKRSKTEVVIGKECMEVVQIADEVVFSKVQRIRLPKQYARTRSFPDPMNRLLLPIGLCAALGLLAAQGLTDDPAREWREYLGGPDRNHYSPLNQIHTGNVTQLTKAWEYRTGDTTGQMQCNPIIVDGVMYAPTSSVRIVAVDAATGKELWRAGDPLAAWHSTSRGVAYWADGDDKRILYTVGPWLCALDARTGQPIPGFGENGRTSLKAGLGETARDKFVVSNTPGTIFGDLIIMPMRLSEGADAALGYVQAFNIRTGQLAWVFRTIPNPGEYGYDTWPKDVYKNTEVGAANNWSGMAVDRKRGILYVPTGSAAFDFYGGNRKGQNLFANCLLALDARTGKRLWHFQFVHHDIWDRDLPAPPNLTTVTQNGKKIDAVAQITKSGHVFVFDRVTGKPLFPIKETPVPQTDLPGEYTWPTQPLPLKPKPFSRQSFSEDELSPYAENREELLATYRKARKGPFAPMSKEGTLIFPGLDGGGEWGGAAVDPDGIMYVNANEMAWFIRMIETPRQDQLAHLSTGQRIYTMNCATCHGAERKGNPASGYPSLVDISRRRDRPFVHNIVSNGKGMMPGFAQLSATDKQALVAFLFGDEKQEVGGAAAASAKPSTQPYIPYKISGYNKFLDSKGLPAIAPPWGTLTAIDLNTGEHRWQIRLGEHEALTAKGIPPTGTENYGGPVVTAGGLIFIAATLDGKFRAFERKTGKLLWETKLPAAGFATPSTYEVNGKQYVVVACGGTKLNTRKGDSFVAFALP